MFSTKAPGRLEILNQILDLPPNNQEVILWVMRFLDEEAALIRLGMESFNSPETKEILQAKLSKIAEFRKALGQEDSC